MRYKSFKSGLMTYSKLWTLTLLTILLSCNNQTDRKNVTQADGWVCKPYFSFDQVDHYYFDITEEAILKIVDNQATMKNCINCCVEKSRVKTSALKNVERSANTLKSNRFKGFSNTP